ncbi:MAG: hypothetical protein KC475_03955 [Cyanobacteria bacterium HKST-UBA03]|nr:hypothetical protein [Cyanobacteria bacterium HKST-UBA03]
MSPSAGFDCHGTEAFTEDGYKRLLETALGRYRFEPFGTTTTTPHILMRHDIDFSVQRAVALARIEAAFHIQTTYCVLLHTPFYNVLEPKTQDALAELVSLGHHIGLHFDCALTSNALNTLADLEAPLTREHTLLSLLVNTPIRVVSFHNPDVGDVMNRFEQDYLAGLINTYSRTLKEGYTYCSDSNGYWRHANMFEVVAGRQGEPPDHKPLHLLTHPGWWVPDGEAADPRQRIERCIQGRARYTADYYDGLMVENQRLNLGAPQDKPHCQPQGQHG